MNSIITRAYLKDVMNGTRPKMFVPRTPTVDAAIAHLQKTKEANLLTDLEYIKREILNDKDNALVLSPFPQACDWGLTEYTYWMKHGYDSVEHVRIRVANRLMERPDDIYIIKGDETAGVPNYQVFVESDPQEIQAPWYELPGDPPKSAHEYQAEWSALLGVPVKVKCGFRYSWLPETTMKHGLLITGFKVQRRSDLYYRRLAWFLWIAVAVGIVASALYADYYY